MNTNHPYVFPPVSLLEPNDSAQDESDSIVRIRELIDTELFRKETDPLAIPVGVDSAEKPVFIDLAKLPHLLIAGRSGAGKSMWLYSAITGLLYRNSPDRVKLLLIDPKRTAFDDYKNLPHLAIPVAQRWQEVVDALNWAVDEMKCRLELSDKESLPHIVVIIDEIADLIRIAPDDAEKAICRLAQRGHTVGMHLIIATQCPVPDIITEAIKAAIPSHVAFSVASEEDSCHVLETTGAETLNGQGDMLFAPAGAQKPIRLQGAYVSGMETERIVNFINEQNG